MKKWSAIYNDYKEDKAMNMKLDQIDPRNAGGLHSWTNLCPTERTLFSMRTRVQPIPTVRRPQLFRTPTPLQTKVENIPRNLPSLSARKMFSFNDALVRLGRVANIS